VPIETDDVRLRPGASEVERLCSNPARASEQIGWAAQWSLRDGLQATIDWIRARGAPQRVEEFVV
jgi:nucleoside-diphosphate-sugar epimerase